MDMDIGKLGVPFQGINGKLRENKGGDKDKDRPVDLHPPLWEDLRQTDYATHCLRQCGLRITCLRISNYESVIYNCAIMPWRNLNVRTRRVSS